MLEFHLMRRNSSCKDTCQTAGTGQISMTLGTAQLGLAYGAANQTGQPPETEAVRLIHSAIDAGVTHLDCAQVYGTAEEVVGKALRGLRRKPVVVTKLDPLVDLTDDVPQTQVAKRTKDLIERSSQRLGLDRLDVLMLHRWQHRTSHRVVIWQTLLELREEGRIISLGASVQNPAEALQAVRDPDVDYLQLPFNLLDWRWHEAEVCKAIQNRDDLVVHARSALLQGLLAADAAYWPKLYHPPSRYPRNFIERIRNLTANLGRKNAVDLCLAYARAQDWIDSVVVGVETAVQLDENIALYHEPSLNAAEIRQVRQAFPPEQVPEQLLDPARWSVHA